MFMRTSEMPNMPMMIATISNPLVMLVNPRVNRSLPLTMSIPTVEMNSPNATINRAFNMEPPTMNIVTTNPRVITPKYSGGPNFSAAATRMGEKKFRPSVLNVPAMKEPMAAIPRAAPARPCFAIWWPSRQVTTDAASPGMLTSMEVVEPPYMDP